jgi:hypothetical protein
VRKVATKRLERAIDQAVRKNTSSKVVEKSVAPKVNANYDFVQEN